MAVSARYLLEVCEWRWDCLFWVLNNPYILVFLFLKM